MPPLFSKRKISDAENRLRLLFCIECLGIATPEQLWPFVAKLELMDYVPMCLYLAELKKDGSLLAEDGPVIKGALTLSGEGRKALTLFLDRLPQADRDKIRRAAPGYAAQLQEKRQIRTAHERAERGRYRVSCSIVEGDLPTLLLTVDTRRKSLSNGAMKHFRQCAPRLLTLLYTLSPPESYGGAPAPMEGDFDAKSALREVSPQRPLLCAFGKHEYGGVICLREDASELRLLLLHPTLQSARDWVSAASQNEGLLKKLCALLEGGEA